MHKQHQNQEEGPITITGVCKMQQKSLYPLVENMDRGRQTNLPGDGVPKLKVVLQAELGSLTFCPPTACPVLPPQQGTVGVGGGGTWLLRECSKGAGSTQPSR